MNKVVEMALTIFGCVLASSGFWAFIQKRRDGKDLKSLMLKGLAHDRIVFLGLHYLGRGDWITQDEYETLYDYLWVPYDALGGNGSAKKIMDEVNKLRIVKEKPATGA